MTVAFANRQRTKKIDLRLLKQIANALLTELEVEKAEIVICLVAATEITRLNEQFLRHKGPTDVIAFDYHTEGGTDSRLAIHRSPLPAPKSGAQRSTRPTLQGEIFICVDEAIRQARQFGTSWQSETARYVVHGVLHLLGYDDVRAVARRKMRREENRLLREITRRFPLSKL